MGEHHHVAVREQSPVDSAPRALLDRLEQRVATAASLIERVAHLLAGAGPCPAIEQWLPSLHLEDEESALRVENHEVRLAFAQRLSGKIAVWTQPRK